MFDHAVVPDRISAPYSPNSLAFDDLPVLIENEVETPGNHADGMNKKFKDARKERQSNDVHEKTETGFVGFVEELMHERVAKNKQLVLAPIVALVADENATLAHAWREANSGEVACRYLQRARRWRRVAFVGWV